MEKGLVHLYYGSGKGKTTAAIGQVIRAAGHHMKIFIFQFLKSPEGSGEVSVLKSIPGIDYMDNTVDTPFLFNLSPAQKEHYIRLYSSLFSEIRNRINCGNYDMAVLDEAVDAVLLGLIDRQDLLDLMKNKPEGCELIITGHRYGDDLADLIELADYVTDCVKIKHPFDKGQGCRKGIEE